jgi:hypothetical protein
MKPLIDFLILIIVTTMLVWLMLNLKDFIIGLVDQRLLKITKFRKKWEIAEILTEWNEGDSIGDERIDAMKTSKLFFRYLSYTNIIGKEATHALGLDDDETLRKTIKNSFECVNLLESKLEIDGSTSMVSRLLKDYADVMKELNIN